MRKPEKKRPVNSPIRARALVGNGQPRAELSRMVQTGSIERIARGVYMAPAADVSAHHTLAVAAIRVPKAIVCLLSALRFHGLGTQSSSQVWLAVPQGTSRRSIDWPPVTFVHLAPKVFMSGVEIHVIDGVPVRVYSKEKTVADCFKFRNKIGLDVALEALREYLRFEARDIDRLWREARVDRVANVLRPYLEAMSR